jgi:hypothetical protein
MSVWWGYDGKQLTRRALLPTPLEGLICPLPPPFQQGSCRLFSSQLR